MTNPTAYYRAKEGLEMFTLLATLKAKPGKEAAVTEICIQLAKVVLSKEEDCLMYIPHVAKNDPGKIVFFEKYKDKQAAGGSNPGRISRRSVTARSPTDSRIMLRMNSF